MRAVFTYHSIDPSGSVISVHPAAFRRHVAELVETGAAIVSLPQLLATPPGTDAIALTFDDGFVNFATEAWPILADAGVPVTVFVVSDRVGRTNAWNDGVAPAIPELPLLDWDAIGRLAEEGVTIGSHTRTHPNLRTAPERVQDEVAGAAETIRREIGQPVEGFAYPFGSYDDRAVAAVRGAHRFACTTELAVLGDPTDPYRIPRLDAYYYRRPGFIARFGSPSFRRHLWVRAAARQVRQSFDLAGRSS
jgi:peptidoglycan/xylan/chitin deacetylase (PgdA/CDA1 family)